MRMMLACGGVPVLLGLFLGRSLHFKRRHLELSSPRRKGMMGGLTANGSPPISSPSRTAPSSTGTPIRSFARISPAARPCINPFCRPMRFTPRSRPRRIRSAASVKAAARPSGRNTRRNGPRATSSPSCARNERDIMTDYFAHSVTRCVLLGFSKSDRNNFREMRKLAATFGPTEKLATEGEENRENYAGGSGYYLSGLYRHSGWTIRKESLKYGLPRGSQAVLDVAHWLETASR